MTYWAKGSAAALGLDGNDLGKALTVMTELTRAANQEKQKFDPSLLAPQLNREQRRRQSAAVIMADILLEPLPTKWEGRAINPDFRPMVWLSNQYQRKRRKRHPCLCAGSVPALLPGADSSPAGPGGL